MGRILPLPDSGLFSALCDAFMRLKETKNDKFKKTGNCVRVDLVPGVGR